MKHLGVALGFVLCSFPLFGQTPIHLTATWSNAPVALSTNCNPWVSKLILIGSNLAFAVELPAGGYQIDLVRPATVDSPDILLTSLGICGRLRDPHSPDKSVIGVVPPGGRGGNESGCRPVLTSVLEGNVDLPDARELLAGLWALQATIPAGPPRRVSTIFRAQIIPLDTDGDGVPDFLDLCPETPAGERVNSNGCSIEQIVPCNGPWKNHGIYLQALKQVTQAFVGDGLISQAEAKNILRAAAQSDCAQR